MSDRLKGKRAFVTAAAAGIGRACALAFAREGASVFATDIDEKGVAALRNEGINEISKLDVRDSAAVNAIARRSGKVDILLNAAGFVHHGTVLDCSESDWDLSNVYGATKAAVAALTRSVAVDFISKGIRCNCICPGTIETPSMLQRAEAAGAGGREMFVSRQPMGRLGTAEEIASLAIYLASDESAFTTGVVHVIDGGWTL